MSDMVFNYRYNGKKEAQVIEFMEYVLDKGYGYTIPLRKAYEILQYNIDDELEKKRFTSLMGRIKNTLIDKGYVLRSIPKVGYYIMKPKQIPDYVYRTYTLRTYSLLDKQFRILKHTNTSQLSDIRRKEYNEINKLTHTTLLAINDTISASEYFANKDKYNKLDD